MCNYFCAEKYKDCYIYILMSRFRAFCFTDYVLDVDFLLGLPYSYLCWGEEVCPTTQRDHLQGFIYLSDAKTESAARKMMEGRHIERQKDKATNDQSIGYCKGDYTNHKGEYKPLNAVFKEYGTKPQQGKRTDINIVLEKIKKGNCTMRDIVSSATSFQSIRMAEIQLKYFEPRRNWETEVYWYYGKSKTGKTKTAYEMCKDPYICMETNKWWEGYDGHEDVIIDDYRTDFCSFRILLLMLDRNGFRVECKGGSRQLRAKRIFITTPKSPQDTWQHCKEEELYQLTRRITEVRHFTDTPVDIDVPDTDDDVQFKKEVYKI